MGTPSEGSQMVITPPRLNQENINIIMEPVMKNKQSMFVVHRYVYDERNKEYKKKS